MIRRPPRSTLDRSSAASDVYKRQAIDSADIVLMNGDLDGVVKAIKLSKQTIQIIKQNLFWAFIYNVIGIPLAGLGLLNPIFAALAMSLSSVSVISNSLRLKKAKL